MWMLVLTGRGIRGGLGVDVGVDYAWHQGRVRCGCWC